MRVRLTGINIFLDGFVPTENMRFREVSLSFKLAETAEENQELERHRRYKYPAMTKTLGTVQARSRRVCPSWARPA